MQSFDLNALSLKELKSLQKDVTQAVDNYEEKKRQDALSALEVKARELGFSLSELTGGAKKAKSPSVPKYRHPENPTMTWSGRGRQPGWIKEAMEQGKSMDDFLIS